MEFFNLKDSSKMLRNSTAATAAAQYADRSRWRITSRTREKKKSRNLTRIAMKV
jgi:hypothetical protein